MHSIVFTGHRIDDPDRKKPRFPQSMEKVATQAIERAILDIQENHQEGVIGIAGGASGGDIIFHESCRRLGIKSRVFLALPSEAFIRQSVVVPGAPDWVERFKKLIAFSEVLTLTADQTLLDECQQQENIWERNNQWILNTALENGGDNATLIALWNGEKGDGPGGTEHMVKQASAQSASVIIVDKGLVQPDKY